MILLSRVIKMKILNEPIKVMAIFNNDGKIEPVKNMVSLQKIKKDQASTPGLHY